MADKLKGKIKSITTRFCWPRTAGMFANELGDYANPHQIQMFLDGAAIPSDALLLGVLRSPDTTPNGRDWARACLKEIEKVRAERTVDLDVERRL